MQCGGVLENRDDGLPRASSCADVRTAAQVGSSEVRGFGMISRGVNTVTLSVHRFTLSCVGIWPVRKETIFTNLRWIIAVILEVTPMCVYFAEIYLHCNGIKESFELVTPCAAAALAFTRLIAPRIYREELLEVVTSMMDDWSTQQDKRMRWIMRKYAKLSTRVTIFTFILVGIIVSVYISFAVSAITVRTEEVDLETDNASIGDLTPTESGIQFCVFRGATARQVFTVVQAMQMFVTGILTFGTTSFFFGLAMHLCAQFDMLSIKLSEFPVGEMRFQALAEAAERHCHLIRMADCMEESFNASVLMYLFVTTTLLCIDGFMLIVSLKVSDLSAIIHYTSVLLLMLIQLSFYTFAGDCLEMRSTALSYATYDCNWYDLPARTARDIHFILMRASIPHQLTAGKFVPMNMITFKDILKSTASYLSVLRVMLDE